MSPTVLLAVLVGVLGLAIGSFLNVVIYRLPRGESLLFPSSHCPRCGVAIMARHNVPVFGWLVLRGRCAACDDPISARYPLVEFVTAALFALVTLRLGITVSLPAALVLVAVAITVALIDVDGQRIPGALLVSALAVELAFLVPAAAESTWQRPVFAAASALALCAVCAAAELTAQRPVDLGLWTFAATVGFALGWLSLSAGLFTCAAALVLLAAAGPLWRALGVRVRSSSVPIAMVAVVSAALGLFAPVALG
jgi:leader peptidase (prepilin peptidase)/N-methyltransferase